MEGQKMLNFIKKYLNLCPEEERKFYEFWIIQGWVNDDRILIFVLIMH